jgi:hypothetical protein
MPKNKTLKHPTFDDVFVQVPEAKSESWKAQGWKVSSEKAANEQNVDVRPADEPAVSA